jgi:integrin beta 8
MTTTQRDAMTPINGMIIYNTTTNTIQGYQNSAWSNL